MRARLQVLPQSGVIVRVRHTRLYHASPTVQRANLRNGELVPNPFASKLTRTAQPIPKIYELVDRKATGFSNSGPSGEQQRFSKEKVRTWLEEKSGHQSRVLDRTFPLDGVKNISDVSEFEALAAHGTAGAPEAMLYLARSRMRVEGLPQAEQRSAAANAGASRILAWVRKTDRRYWDTILPYDFINMLCRHLEAEEKGRILMEWVAAYVTSSDMQRDAVKAHNPLHKRAHVSWPTRIFACLVTAKIYWGEDGSMDAALECLLYALDGGLTKAGRILWIPAAIVELEGRLLQDETPPCSPILFERYRAWLPFIPNWKYSSDRSRLDFHLARIVLYHPVDADPRPILQYCQGENRLSGSREQGKLNSAHEILRASYLLRLEDDNAAARLLENISQDLHPRPWSQLRMLYRKWKDDPKLKSNHSRSIHGKTLLPC
ncbi:hypothetical protein CKM354_001027000 [Cercospora kikuchii]|uniref:Uncharacterized protein n=1 Tax=Cercospora kikuchii TaxID=84275 RepID=A0A9P3CR24_9PEZI|nr:uncharacterized protein CKM354_001027000 [Cercospora kikuchii]GIZ47171.1 hypothetical protein CKM354_001027000 [Cercospora kikuchii]